MTTPTTAVLTLWSAAQGHRPDVPPDIAAAVGVLITRVAALGVEVDMLRAELDASRRPADTLEMDR